jgi:uncharacterized membrane protein
MTFMQAVLVLIALTFVPGLELRASIPFGWFHSSITEHLGPAGVIAISLISNIFVGLITFALMEPVVIFFRQWGWFDRKIWPFFVRAQNKLHPYVEKHGEWGLAVFIGIPLPGTGAYTGAVGAYLLGFDKKRFFLANLAGIFIACTLVVLLCILIQHGAISEDSILRRLFLNEDSMLRRLFLKDVSD